MPKYPLPAPSSIIELPLPRERINTAYIPAPKLDRLMGLRDALVAFNGPLANDPGLRDNLQKMLFNEETRERVLGKVTLRI